MLAEGDAAAQIGRVDASLPQTQCTRCGYPDCRTYASAIVRQEAAINRCPPGGAAGVARLAALTARPVVPLDPSCGSEGPRGVAVIDEAWCIGCTLCLKACPVDSIVGTSKRMHTVVESVCTGCELCVPVCPVDCIEMRPVAATQALPLPTGWVAWTPLQATQARARYDARRLRLQRETIEHATRLEKKARDKLADLESTSRLTEPAALEHKQALLAGVLARARRRAGSNVDDANVSIASPDAGTP